MADIAKLEVLHELMDSDDEKQHRAKTRKWVKGDTRGAIL